MDSDSQDYELEEDLDTGEDEDAEDQFGDGSGGQDESSDHEVDDAELQPAAVRGVSAGTSAELAMLSASTSDAAILGLEVRNMPPFLQRAALSSKLPRMACAAAFLIAGGCAWCCCLPLSWQYLLVPAAGSTRRLHRTGQGTGTGII